MPFVEYPNKQDSVVSRWCGVLRSHYLKHQHYWATSLDSFSPAVLAAFKAFGTGSTAVRGTLESCLQLISEHVQRSCVTALVSSIV